MRRWLPLLLVFGACSPFSSESEGGSGSSSGGADASLAETGANDAGSVDANGLPSDVIVSDSVCSNPPSGTVICEDFDRAGFRQGWDTTPTGSFFHTLLDPAGQSGVGVLQIASQTWPTSGSGTDYLRKHQARSDSVRHTVTLSLSVFVIDFPSGGEDVEIAALDVDKYDLHVNLHRDSDAATVDLILGQFNRSSNMNVPKHTSALTLQTWHRLELKLDVGGGTAAKFQQSVDTGDNVSGLITGDEEPLYEPLFFEASAGVTHVKVFTGPIRYAIDNVLFTDVEP